MQTPTRHAKRASRANAEKKANGHRRQLQRQQQFLRPDVRFRGLPDVRLDISKSSSLAKAKLVSKIEQIFYLILNHMGF